ncbi:MAG: DinB family protein [Chloroflexi bacterium]|nr:DinB family protein [Chloroflexota bacterium]
MLTKANVIGIFAQNLSVINKQTNGLTDEQSLLQPPFRGNCLNWVLGHILSNRSEVLEALEAEGMLSAEQYKRYGYGSEPICGPGQDILPLEQLLEMLRESQVRIQSALENASDELLSEERTLGPNRMPCEELVLFLLWHESYHTGQTELLRQLAGTNDKVI